MQRTELKATAVGKQLEERLLATKGKLTGEADIEFVSTMPEEKQLSLKEVIRTNFRSSRDITGIYKNR